MARSWLTYRHSVHRSPRWLNQTLHGTLHQNNNQIHPQPRVSYIGHINSYSMKIPRISAAITINRGLGLQCRNPRRTLFIKCSPSRGEVVEDHSISHLCPSVKSDFCLLQFIWPSLFPVYRQSQRKFHFDAFARCSALLSLRQYPFLIVSPHLAKNYSAARWLTFPGGGYWPQPVRHCHRKAIRATAHSCDLTVSAVARLRFQAPGFLR